MDTVIARITRSLASAVIASIGYVAALIVFQHWFGPAALMTPRAQAIYYLIEAALLLACVLLPNLKFDRASLAAIAVSTVLVVPVWVLSLLTTACGVFGSCL